MARKPRTIKNIEAQRQRALASTMARSGDYNPKDSYANVVYMASQRNALKKGKTSIEESNEYDNPKSISSQRAFAFRKLWQRQDQINQAARNAIDRLRRQGKDYRASRKARGLSAG